MNEFQNCLLVAFGGATGAVCRYMMRLLPFKDYCSYPINTLIINIIGTFIIGIIGGYVQSHSDVDQRFLLLLQVGFCGGFTTLSSVTLDFLNITNQGQLFTALAYYSANVLICLVSTWIGLQCFK